jgi:peroxiredoxin
MKKLSALALLLALSFVVATATISTTRDASTAPDEKTAAGVAIGAVVPDFTLPDADGKQHTLASLKGSKGTVVIFIATKCPVSNAYNGRMEALAKEYKARGFNVIGINSNFSEPSDEVKKHAAEKGLTFSILKDDGNVIADRFDAQVTPEAYLIDASGKLVYRGRIDNTDPRKGEATSSELREAMDAVLAGKPVEKPEVKAFGCSIKRKTTS